MARYFQTTLAEWEDLSNSTYKVLKSKLNIKKKAFCVRIEQYGKATGRSYNKEALTLALEGLVVSGYLSDYFLVAHSPDFTDPTQEPISHFHMVLVFNGRQSVRTVLELVYSAINDDYSLSPYYYIADKDAFTIDPAIFVEPCNSLHSSVRYLAHLDNPEKGIYPISAIVTNNEDALTKFAVLTSEITVSQLEMLLELNNWSYVATIKTLDVATANRCRNILKDLCFAHNGYGNLS